MKLCLQDYNNVDSLLAGPLSSEWAELENTLKEMPLHVKASDQAGIQGSLIFNPVGTNQAIKEGLEKHDWKYVPMPSDYKFFGLGIDFGKRTISVEAQFSNYPFLLNNTLRAEVLHRDKISVLDGNTLDVLIFITKVKHFPSSNSTLHFEQAVEHLNGLNKHKLFSVPTRLIGLDVESDSTTGVLTEYQEPRYSRTVIKETAIKIEVKRGRSKNSSSKFLVKP